jgi:uncharacterized protein (DUF2147 family)
MSGTSLPPVAGPVVLAGVLLAGILLADVAAAAGPQGVWLTEDGDGAVEILDCGTALCGRIVWQKAPLRADGSLDIDDRNPNPALRQQPICGLQIISEMRRSGPTAWGEGRIYDPDSGKTYQATMTLEEADALRLRGYIGIPLLGASQLWRRAPAGLALCTEATP